MVTPRLKKNCLHVSIFLWADVKLVVLIGSVTCVEFPSLF